MDIEKMVAFFPHYLSEYLSILFLTLQKPTLRFTPSELPKREKDIIYVVGEHPDKTGIKLNPKLISFVILSIFIGSILQGVTPNHPPLKETPTLVITVIAIWLLISTAFFIMFRFFGGKGGFSDTISISLQLLSSIYVIASLVTLIATALFFANDRNFGNSFLVYLATQVVLLVIYLPLALKELHFPSTKVKIGFILAIVLSVTFFLFLVINIIAATQIYPSYPYPYP